jgi:hypothetical protein
VSEPTYTGLDEALVPLHQHLQMLMPEGEPGMTINALRLSMPIEVDIVPEADGQLSVGTSPPLYYVQTGFEVIPHRLRVTIVEESQLLPRV